MFLARFAICENKLNSAERAAFVTSLCSLISFYSLENFLKLWKSKLRILFSERFHWKLAKFMNNLSLKFFIINAIKPYPNILKSYLISSHYVILSKFKICLLFSLFLACSSLAFLLLLPTIKYKVKSYGENIVHILISIYPLFIMYLPLHMRYDGGRWWRVKKNIQV